MRLATRLASGLLLALVACGCSSEPEVYEVTGTVTLDGKPLKDGEVLFTAVDNSSSSAGKIEDGRYRLTARAGPQRVIINSSVRARNPYEPPPGAPRRDDWYYKSIIPARYNDETTLSAEVDPSGDNQFNFQLTSAPE